MGGGGPRLGRRALLLTMAGGIATTAFSSVSGVASHSDPIVIGLRAGLLEPDPAVVTVEKVRSRGRGRDIDMLTITPAGFPAAELPVCLLLHGRGGNARYAAIGGMAETLSDLVAQGRIRPFALVALDGGPTQYWHRHGGDDPMAMLLDDVPRWLAARGFVHTRPFAAAGVSMGGFGALVYGRRCRERGIPIRAVATIAPALITSWAEMHKRKAFRDQAVWRDLDPLRHPRALAGVPVGVWCGSEDRFVEGVRRYARLAAPEVASITPGGHNDAFYRAAVPEMIEFLDRHLD